MVFLKYHLFLLGICFLNCEFSATEPNTCDFNLKLQDALRSALTLFEDSATTVEERRISRNVIEQHFAKQFVQDINGSPTVEPVSVISEISLMDALQAGNQLYAMKSYGVGLKRDVVEKRLSPGILGQNLSKVSVFPAQTDSTNDKLYGYYITTKSNKVRQMQLTKILENEPRGKVFVSAHVADEWYTTIPGAPAEPHVTDSHVAVLRRCIDLGLPTCLILEDDATWEIENHTLYETYTNALSELNGSIWYKLEIFFVQCFCFYAYLLKIVT